MSSTEWRASLRDSATRALSGVVSDAVLCDEDLRVETYARGLWMSVVEPGDAVAGALIRERGAVEAWHLLASGRLADRAAYERWAPRLPEAAGLFERGRRERLALVTPEDVRFPARLSDLGDHAPLGLWVAGNTDLLAWPRPLVALVGARAATSYGSHLAAEFAAELALTGAGVVSGAAYGIDASAHRGALAAEGFTIAVLAGGADVAYPAGHRELLARIADRGVIISELAPGMRPTRWRFLQRNRIIAALSDATVVVEAGWRSGSLNTAGHAATLGRPLGAVPGPVTSAASRGCHRLLREYAAQCITSADDVREMLGFTGGAEPGTSQGHDSPPPTRVVDALSRRVGRSSAEIARRAGMSVADAQAGLGRAELTGEAVRDGSGWRRV